MGARRSIQFKAKIYTLHGLDDCNVGVGRAPQLLVQQLGQVNLAGAALRQRVDEHKVNVLSVLGVAGDGKNYRVETSVSSRSTYYE